MLHEQLKLPLNKRDLSINKYYIPFCADCPICQGQNKLIIREDNINGSDTDLVIVCESCHTGGFLEDWEEIEKSDTILPNTHRDVSNIYIDSLKNFTKNYYKCEQYINKFKYYSPTPPPGNPFSILTREQLEQLMSILGRSDKIRPRDYYLTLPVYEHPGLICAVLVNDGVRYWRIPDERPANQFCGTLSNAFVKKLFLVESVSELIRFLGKQRLEGIHLSDAPVIAGIFGTLGIGTHIFNGGRIRAENIYVLRNTAIKPPKLWEKYINNIAGSIRIIENWDAERLSVVVANSFDMSRPMGPKDKPSIITRKEEISRMYRFIIREDYICVAGFKKTKARFSEVEAIVSGIIYVEELKNGKYRIIYQRQKKKPIVRIDNVPAAIFRDKQVFNIYLANNLPKGQGMRLTLLLDWFDNHDILSNLVLISEQTAEVFKKGESHAD